MSTLSPRANETETVVALLESDEHTDAASLAKAIVRALGAELARRDAYLIVEPGGSFAYGPYWTEGQARKAWEKEIGPASHGAARIVRSFPWGQTEAVVAETVCECGHQPAQHVVKNRRGGKTGPPAECGVCAQSVKKGARNDCAKYTERKTA